MKYLSILSYLFLSALMLTGCDSGGSSDSQPPADVSGTWEGALIINGQVPGQQLTFQFVQDGNSISATDSAGRSYSGSVSGNQVDLVYFQSFGGDNQATIDVAGSVNENAMLLDGTATERINEEEASAPVTISLTFKEFFKIQIHHIAGETILASNRPHRRLSS